MMGPGSDAAGNELSPAVYERVFYSIQNPALVIDTEFAIRDANEAAAEFLEFESREELLGTAVEDILANPSILEDVAEQISQNRYWMGEAEIVTAKEEVRMGIGTAVPIDVEGEPQMIAGVFTDVTERRRYTRSVKILNRILRHNIRNDATLLLGTLEQIAMTSDDEQVVEYTDKAREILGNVIDNADTARELEVLLFRQGGPIGTLRLDSVLEQVLADAGQEYPHARFDYSDELPAVKVVAGDAIGRILQAVIDNAVVHNEGSEPRVRISIVQSETSVLLEIADDGPGVPADRRDVIFGREELSQLHHGDGFSLFFVDQVMEVIGGDVWVEDSDLGGTACYLEFPRPHRLST